MVSFSPESPDLEGHDPGPDPWRLEGDSALETQLPRFGSSSVRLVSPHLSEGNRAAGVFVRLRELRSLNSRPSEVAFH